MRRALLLVALLAASSCGDSTTPAPLPGPAQTVCTDAFCLDHPADWEVELGEDFISLRHRDETKAMATVSRVDMRGVVEGAGGTWPAATDETVERFWELLDELGSASLASLEALDDGSVRSEGSLEGGRLWHRLIPVDAPSAIGVEVRAPGRDWGKHADVMITSLEPVGDG